MQSENSKRGFADRAISRWSRKIYESRRHINDIQVDISYEHSIKAYVNPKLKFHHGSIGWGVYAIEPIEGFWGCETFWESPNLFKSKTFV